MKFEYKRQLPDGSTRTSKFEGWVAAIVGTLIFLGLAVVFFVFILPAALIAFLLFLAFILFLLVGGWIWLGFKIGFRELWDLTKLAFAFRRGGNWQTHYGNIRREWEQRSRGRHGEWMK
ncbi:MAG TPA: hypothetical protein VGB30_00765 [bacterium]|jgi:hypothetical protein